MKRFSQNTVKSKPCLFVFLCILVFLITYILLVMPAKSMENGAVCGIEAHTHSDACYTTTYTNRILSCGIETCNQYISHTHNALCYDDAQGLICPLNEIQHIHGKSCYDEAGILVCGYIYHAHSEECFTTSEEAVAQRVLICGKIEHTHDASCMEFDTEPQLALSNPTPDNSLVIMDADSDAFDRAPVYAPLTRPLPARNVVIDPNALVLNTSNTSDVTFQYQLGDANWKDASENEILSADVNYRIQVKFNVPITTLQQGGYQLLLHNIPHWLDADKEGELLYMGRVIAKTTVQEQNGNNILVVEFDKDFVDEQAKTQSTILGTLYVRGAVDWRKLENNEGSINIPPLDKTFHFESDLPQKYGAISIDKSNPVLVNETYLKYTITVISSEAIAIPDVRVEDVFTTNAEFIQHYVGITNTATTLPNQANGQNPYETSTASTYSHGTVNLNNNGGMVWDIGEIGAGETRTLTYYAEIDPYYIGAITRGSIDNTAAIKCGTIPRGNDKSTYTPKAKADVQKEKVSSSIDSATGSGTISYKVTVKADRYNSYTLKNLEVKDFFPEKYRSFVTFQDVRVNGQPVTNHAGDSSLSCTIPTLAAGQTATITYTVALNSILLSEREGFTLTNTAQLLSETNPNRGKASGKPFDSAHTDEWFSQKEWIRKLDGGSIANDITVNTGTETFTVPAKSRKYQVIINEDGTWDLHSATFKDSFSNDSKGHIAYKGWLKVEQYDRYDSEIQSGEFTNKLEGVTPLKTSWVNIDGQTSFAFKPEDLQLDTGKYVYLLTYYATPTTMDFGTITITNNFELYGTIGVDGGTIVIDSVKIGVASKVQGSVSYNVEKNAWYYDDSDHGYTYWVVALDGTIKRDFALQDIPREKESKDANFSAATKVNPSTLLGIYRGTDENNPLNYSSYNDFLAANSELPRLQDYDEGAQYILQNITDTTDLDGRSFVIANLNVNNSNGYAIGSYTGTGEYVLDNAPKKGGIKAKAFAKTKINSNNVFTCETEAVWTFHKKAGTSNQYCLSTIYNGTVYYLNLKDNGDKSLHATTDLIDSSYFTVEPSTYRNGEVSIKNVYNRYATYVNNDPLRFTSDNDTVTNSSSLSLIEWITSQDYTVNATNSELKVHFQKNIPLASNEKLYAIFRVEVNSKMADKKSDYKIYENSIYAKDPNVSQYTIAGSDTIIVKPCNAVLKEARAVTVFNGKQFPSYGLREDKGWGDRANTSYWKRDLITEAGVYCEWIIHVNWDGSLLDTAEVSDMLPEHFTPVYVRFTQKYNGITTPDIDEYELSDEWESHMYYDIKYYYNPKTREVRWNVAGLNKTDLVNDNSSRVQCQIVCRINDPDMMLTGSYVDLENYVSVFGTDGVDTAVSEDTGTVKISPNASAKKDIDTSNSNNVIANNSTYQYSTIPFIVTVNEGNLDLRTQGLDTLPPMIDELGSSDVFSFIEDSLHIRDAAGEITDFSYAVRTDEASKKQVLTISRLPADRKLEITYTVKINAGSGIDNVTLTNAVHWQGYDPTPTPHYEKTFNYALSGNIELDGHPKFKITKVDNDNMKLTLKDAKFSLYAVNSDGSLTAEPLQTATTGNDGVITFGTNNALSYNTLYCIVETQAPEGYHLNDGEAKHYVVAVNTTDNAGFNATPYPAEIVNAIEYSYNVSQFNTTIKNKREKIYVSKTFNDPDGTEITPISGSYSFGIYDEPVRTGNEKRMQLLTITYDNGDVSYKLDGNTVDEAAFTCAALNTAYYIYELDAQKRPILNGSLYITASNTFEVFYASGFNSMPNKAVAYEGTNIVQITNQQKIIVMPSSGGVGLANYYRYVLLFIPLFGVMFVLYLRYKTDCTESES